MSLSTSSDALAAGPPAGARVLHGREPVENVTGRRPGAGGRPSVQLAGCVPWGTVGASGTAGHSHQPTADVPRRAAAGSSWSAAAATPAYRREDR